MEVCEEYGCANFYYVLDYAYLSQESLHRWAGRRLARRAGPGAPTHKEPVSVLPLLNCGMGLVSLPPVIRAAKFS